MDEGEWEKKDVEDFTRLVEQPGHAWKLSKKKLELINIGIKQDNKELKFGMLIIAYVRSDLVTLLQNYVYVFAWLYANMYSLDTKIMMCVCVYL